MFEIYKQIFNAQQYILQQYELYNLTFTSAEQCLKCLLPLVYVLPISLFIESMTMYTMK